MQRLTSVTVLAVMMLFAASPVLACMLPEPQMSQEEQACCQQMAGDCGDMADSTSGMPDFPLNHSCCQKTTTAVQTAVASDKVSSQAQIFSFANAPAMLVNLDSPEAGFAPRWHLRINSPPPPAISVTILRI